VLAGKGKWGAYVAKHITPKLDGYRRSTVDALIAKADGKDEEPGDLNKTGSPKDARVRDPQERRESKQRQRKALEAIAVAAGAEPKGTRRTHALHGVSGSGRTRRTSTPRPCGRSSWPPLSTLPQRLRRGRCTSYGLD
jgi:hypothetical protein